jgi:hypothetical protein
MKTRCGERMGQAGNAERLSNVFGERHLGAAENQCGQETAPPRPYGLLKPLGNITPQISQRRPRTPEYLNAVEPESTPTALAGQTFRRSRQQWVSTRHWTPKNPSCTDVPALEQRRSAVRELQLSATPGPTILDSLNLQQDGTP